MGVFAMGVDQTGLGLGSYVHWCESKHGYDFGLRSGEVLAVVLPPAAC